MTTMMVVYMDNILYLSNLYLHMSVYYSKLSLVYLKYLICVTDDDSEEEEAPVPKKAAPVKPASKATPVKPAPKAAPAKESSEEEEDGVFVCFYASYLDK